MNTAELTDIIENLEHCRRLTTRIMTAQLEEDLSPSDFEFNMQLLASNIDDEGIRLDAILNASTDNKGAINEYS